MTMQYHRHRYHAVMWQPQTNRQKKTLTDSQQQPSLYVFFLKFITLAQLRWKILLSHYVSNNTFPALYNYILGNVQVSLDLSISVHFAMDRDSIYLLWPTGSLEALNGTLVNVLFNHQCFISILV